MRAIAAPAVREITLLRFDLALTSADVIAAAATAGLARPVYEDALYFGATYPDVQRDGPITFLHEPWFGFFGRWDVITLWTNAGRREIGLDGFEERWRVDYRFAFVRPT